MVIVFSAQLLNRHRFAADTNCRRFSSRSKEYPMFHAFCSTILIWILFKDAYSANLESIPVDEVKKFATELSTISGPAVDVAEALKMVTAKTAPFIKLAGPVSSLVATFLEVGFPPTSDELKAIYLLRSTILDEFKAVGRRIQHVKTDLLYNLELKDYHDQVGLQLSDLLFAYDLAFGTANGTTFHTTLKTKCLHDSSPFKSLSWLKDVTTTYCPLPTSQEATIFAMAQELFRDIENTIVGFNEYMPSYDRYVASKRQVIGKLTMLGIRHSKFRIGQIKKGRSLNTKRHRVRNAQMILKVRYLSAAILLVPSAPVTAVFLCLKNSKPIIAVIATNKTYESLEEIISLVKAATTGLDFSGNHDLRNQCLLKNVIKGEDYKRAPLQGMAQIIRYDLVILATVSAICVNVSADGDLIAIRKMNNFINYHVEMISRHTRLWMEAKLSTFWPEVALEYAKQAVGKDDISDPYAYNATARRVMKAMIKRGPPKFLHTVLIGPAWNTQEFYYNTCEDAFCVRLANYKSVNIFIARFRDDAIRKASIAQLWFRMVESNITKIIAQNWKTDSLPGLLNIITENVGEFGTYKTYPNIVFYHNSKLFADDCEIPLGIKASDGIEDYPTYQVVEYWNPGITPQNAERFKLAMFL
ncbi:hypothetical protein DdX_13535 [Ditylenchus destructor]|uniref:Uncharacterized protein n=1 Tax=Ditylenchus destructor TaxID=166010 RepID=A0AAD4R2R6_9BILA|nr:hypothetical protein DdX_13535 [Ditylenchus destructor]